MTDSDKCPLDKGPCIYTDRQVLDFVMKKTELPEECMTLFCPNFRQRLIHVIKNHQREKLIPDVGLIRRAEELNSVFEDPTVSGMFG